ncbi:DNA-binding transcriptional regulator, MarR family [Microlunatus flavus]|uniref:DNA-binding transcriptional regulator, MarR family n=1 Tax=Microlunatus flavus TaxID=1036181 RepID=A0A1H9J0C0_9ACTN|nr:DNA-binding transcriptional regulator, MarR family [Microlunatus flavus]
MRQVFDDLVRFETILWNRVDEELQREADLSLGGLNALLVIEATPRCRVQDVARALAITVGGTSQAVDRLEKAGLVERTSHPTDRRSSVLALTGAGSAALRRAGPVFDRALERMLARPLGDERLATLAAALHDLRGSAT